MQDLRSRKNIRGGRFFGLAAAGQPVFNEIIARAVVPENAVHRLQQQYGVRFIRIPHPFQPFQSGHGRFRPQRVGIQNEKRRASQHRQGFFHAAARFQCFLLFGKSESHIRPRRQMRTDFFAQIAQIDNTFRYAGG